MMDRRPASVVPLTAALSASCWRRRGNLCCFPVFPPHFFRQSAESWLRVVRSFECVDSGRAVVEARAGPFTGRLTVACPCPQLMPGRTLCTTFVLAKYVDVVVTGDFSCMLPTTQPSGWFELFGWGPGQRPSEAADENTFFFPVWRASFASGICLPRRLRGWGYPGDL